MWKQDQMILVGMVELVESMVSLEHNRELSLSLSLCLCVVFVRAAYFILEILFCMDCLKQGCSSWCTLSIWPRCSWF